MIAEDDIVYLFIFSLIFLRDGNGGFPSYGKKSTSHLTYKNRFFTHELSKTGQISLKKF
jgi:hypothetical protein